MMIKDILFNIKLTYDIILDFYSVFYTEIFSTLWNSSYLESFYSTTTTKRGGGGKFSMTVNNEQRGVEGHRIEKEHSSFA